MHFWPSIVHMSPGPGTSLGHIPPPPPSVPPPVQVQLMSTQSQLDMPYVQVWSTVQGVEAMGCVAGQPFEPLPPAPPEPVVPPPVLELVALPAEPDVVA